MSLRNDKKTTAAAESSSASTAAADSATAAAIEKVGGAVDRGIPRFLRLVRLALPPYKEDHEWEKDDVTGILHWMKQCVAVVVGIALGAFDVRGWVGFAVGVGAQFSVCKTFVEAARVPDTFYTPTEALQEGAMATFMTFVLFWTLTHTLLNVTK